MPRSTTSRSVQQPASEVGREQAFERSVDGGPISSVQGVDPYLDVAHNFFPIGTMQANGLLEKSVEQSGWRKDRLWMRH